MNRHLTLLLATTVAAAFALGGCDQPMGFSDDDTGGNFVLNGKIENYDLGEQEISPNTDSSLGQGTLKADGSFTMTLFGAQEIEEELQSVDPDGDFSDKFSGFICEDEADSELPDDARFAIASGFTFAYDVDDDGTYESGLLGLTSDAPDIVIPIPNSAKGDYHVYWIFASQSVTLDTECSISGRERVVDLALDQGWNEVAYDLSNRDKIRQYTDSRPSGVSWQVDI